MKDILIDEDHYSEMMTQIVVPYLDTRAEERWPERETGKKIHCMYYRADHPKGIVVISHGFTESIEKYKEVIYYFLIRNYSVYMAEYCGHGFSYRLVEDYSLVHVDSFRRYVRDLLFISKAVQKENPGMPLYLYAHSMGGGIGAAAAAKAPYLYRALILSSPMIQPLTAGVPWDIARNIAAAMCMVGKNKDYVIGTRPYEGEEPFETSCSLSKPRYDYYQKKRVAEKHYQTRSASYGWLYGADILNRYLQQKAWRDISVPVLLFQASQENVVSTYEQNIFVQKINLYGNTQAEFVKVPGAKHEIFNSENKVLEGYWEKIFAFMEG